MLKSTTPETKCGYAKPAALKSCPKLQPRWTGPYIIRQRISDLVYKIKKIGGKPIIVHHNWLKPYQERHPDPEHNLTTNPTAEQEPLTPGLEHSSDSDSYSDTEESETDAPMPLP